jgi:hypothetical protein
MADVVIKQDEFLQLDKIIGDIPAKHALPIINFLNQVIQLRGQEEQAASAKVPLQLVTDSADGGSLGGLTAGTGWEG